MGLSSLPEGKHYRLVSGSVKCWRAMLAGKRPFDVPPCQRRSSCIREGEPNWSALPTDTPVSIRMLLARCLRQDPRKRLHDIADGLIEMEEGSESGYSQARQT
jgi:hypothetical protein